MTEIYFDGAMYVGQRAHKKKSRKQGDARSGARTAIMGIGAAGMVWGGITLLNHPVRSTSVPAPASGVPASSHSNKISKNPDRISVPGEGRSVVARSMPREDRSAAGDDSREDRYLASTREDRYVPGFSNLDARRVAWFPPAQNRFTVDRAGRFMLDPIATGDASRLVAGADQPDMNASYAEAFHPVAVAAATTAQGGVAIASIATRVPPAEAPQIRVAGLPVPTTPELPDQSLPVPSLPPRAGSPDAGKESQEYNLASLQPSGKPDSGSRDTSEAALSAAAPTIVQSLPEVVPLPDLRPDREPADAPSRAPARKVPDTALAYARPDSSSSGSGGGGGLFDRLFGHGSSGSAKLPGPGSGIAVYDIKAATVYLPNGQRLEAHSGLGQMQDNPRYVTAKMRGPTPPNVYNLVMREKRFHGVEAVRLLPADGKKKYGRDGLLAHTYMYVGGGGRNQSNGCVVFKDYHKFLAAFKAGQIKRMIVVPSIDQLPSYMASL